MHVQNISQLDSIILLEYVTQIISKLEDHSDTMITYSTEEIIHIMRENRAIVIVNPENIYQVWGFAQLYPWQENASIVAIEFQTWLSFSQEKGKLVVAAAKRISDNFYPGISLYAVVAESNSKAQLKLTRCGAMLCNGFPPGIPAEVGNYDEPSLVYKLL